MKPSHKAKIHEDGIPTFSEDFMTERKQPPLQERASFEQETNYPSLPDGWAWRTLGEIADVPPRIDKSNIPDDALVSFVPMPAVGAGNGHIDVSQLRPAKEVKKGYTPFQAGDVLFAKITPCMENGKMAIVPRVINGYGFGSTEFHVLRPKQDIDTRYLYHFVSNTSFRREAAHNMTGAVGQKRVSVDFIKTSMIPLAPPDQQKLIVSEIEKQFSRLDEAVTALKRIKVNLKRYKASVLKAAVEGKLTEEWRKENAKKNNIIFPWPVVKLKDVTVKVGSGATPRGGKISYKPIGIPLIRSMNIHFSGFKVEGLAFIDEQQARQLDNVKVIEGDVLLNITGASIGRVTTAPRTMEGARVNQHVCIYE